MNEGFRWKLTDDDDQQVLFAADEVMERRKGIGEFGGLEFLHIQAKKAINEVPKSSRMPFRFTINAYRGCSHACVYCFARPTHEYLNLGLGSDFETKIVVKVNIVEKVRAELRSAKWAGASIAMGTNTDPYQRAEGKYRLTRGIVEALADAANPFSILTKGTLVLRDLDLLVHAAQQAQVAVNFSIPTLDAEVWRRIEPGAPHPAQRVHALRKVAEAGIETGVLIAPVLPGISDSHEQLSDVVGAVVDAGASWVAASPLHLKPGVKEHWMAWLEAERPELVERYRRSYVNRAYLPSTERSAIAGKAAALVDTLRPRSTPPRAPRKRTRRALPNPIPGSSTDSQAQQFEQLTLGCDDECR